MPVAGEAMSGRSAPDKTRAQPPIMGNIIMKILMYNAALMPMPVPQLQGARRAKRKPKRFSGQPGSQGLWLAESCSITPLYLLPPRRTRPRPAGGARGSEPIGPEDTPVWRSAGAASLAPFVHAGFRERGSILFIVSFPASPFQRILRIGKPEYNLKRTGVTGEARSIHTRIDACRAAVLFASIRRGGAIQARRRAAHSHLPRVRSWHEKNSYCGGRHAPSHRAYRRTGGRTGI